MSLTERIVRDAKPDGKARTIWDKQVMGLGLQITPTGIKNYVIRYRVGDQKRQAILARAGQISLKDARERAGAELVRIRAGEADPLQRRRDAREAPTMAQFIEQFFAVEVPARIARGRMKPITAETYGYQSRTHILPAIGTRRVANVTRADIEHMVASLPGPTRNRVLALASSTLHARGNMGIASARHESDPQDRARPRGSARPRAFFGGTGGTGERAQ